MSISILDPYQKHFIDFLVVSRVLSFGEFKLKSGRIAPYFINTGSFDDGQKISELGKFYATHLKTHGFEKASVIFGPAYKGIPLSVATAIGLQSEFGISTGFTFDRKEPKDHGDKGALVGREIKDGDSIIIVEDVITAGTTLQKIIPMVRSIAKVSIDGVIVSVDRAEKGTGTLSALQEIESAFSVRIYPIVTIDNIVEYLSAPNNSGFELNSDQLSKIEEYWREYRA